MKKLTLCLVFCLLVSALSYSQSTISGQVTGIGARPLAGASVHLINTNLGTIADTEGRFTLAQVPSGSHTIQVSAVGYATMLKEIAVDGSQNALQISLS